MRRLVTAAFILALLHDVANAATPADFEGRWTVTRMVGASNAGTGDDYHALLGTTVEWRADRVKDADGDCRVAHPTVAPIPNDTLQHDVWGGQTINGLTLSKMIIAHAFGPTKTPVFNDGGKGCARAVLLNQNQLLLPFSNGYVYLLDRDLGTRRAGGN